ncbi:HIT-like protein [Coniochaeta sp. PMI_546]|nr:HIT-like protein [Coniochaeta sp. PMI_546]
MNWFRTARKPISNTSIHSVLIHQTAVRRLRMTSTQGPIRFGDFEVTEQVFLTTPHSFALVNLKPLLPGHVLVCPQTPHKRLTDLSPEELTDLFTVVQRVERMLARHYFSPQPSSSSSSSPPPPSPHGSKPDKPSPEAGSFNIALQDGPEAGQTVSHVHVHVIPRIRGYTAKPGTPGAGGGDELYEKMAGEEGNVGGALWDRRRQQQQQQQQGDDRPRPGGGFPSIEDADRRARSMEEMVEEAGLYRRVLGEMEREESGQGGAAGEKKASDVGSPDWWSRVWPKGGPTDAGPLA